MPTTRPKRGIERKILTSILWVGILPIALALIGGYTTLRATQRNDVMEDLAVSAQKMAEGLRFAANTRLEGLQRLAAEPRIVDALRPVEGGLTKVQTSSEHREELTSWLERMAHTSVEPVATVTLYDSEGQLLLTTGDPEHTIEDPSTWAERVDGPRFIRLDHPHDAPGGHMAESWAPVMLPGTSVTLGYVAKVGEVEDLIAFVFGPADAPGARRPPRKNHHQLIVRLRDDRLMALERDETNGAPTHVIRSIDPRLGELIRDPETADHAVRLIPGYQAEDTTQDAFVGYHYVSNDRDYYIVVYRPASVVFSALDRGAVIAGLGAALIVAFLCIQAYRNVHNNIVRPVSLLNEGAQIIGQGDLELKLKIDTGDEIEELADSFNKMALALNRNIRQLEESEEKYRSVVTSMRDGIFQTDANHGITFLNPAGAEILGLSAMEEAQARNLDEFFLVSTDLRRIVEELDKKGFVERTRVWMKRKDGRAICVELSANCMTDENNHTTGVEGIFRDVTKSIRLEQEARERAERLSAINQIANVINSSLEAGLLYENLVVEIKKLVDFDYAALALLDDSAASFRVRPLWPAQSLGQEWSASMDPEASCPAWVYQKNDALIVDDLHTPFSLHSNQFPEGIRSCICVPLYAKDRIIGTLNLGANEPRAYSNHDVAVLSQVSPHVAAAIRNAQLLENLQSSLEEVTRAREQLHQANEELKTLDEMKTNLLSNVSHELRTPLVAVMGYTDMMINEKVGPINDMQQEYLRISLRNIDKLVTLIENLLDFSRLHRGAETLSFDEFDITDCARAAFEIVQPLADSRDIKLILNAPEEPVIVEGDKGKIGQVFNNLMSNAVKFNRPNGSVTVDIREGEHTIDVSVTDTGIGIPSDAWDKVFTRFYQYDSSSTRKYGGTGIGLSIAQDIMRLHGSRLYVASTEGEGTTFRFSLPRQSKRTDEDGNGQAHVPLPMETELLVELVSQDRALATQVRNLLEPEGIELLNAVSSHNALAMAHKHHPDCLVVDSEVKEDTEEVLNALLRDDIAGDVPVILLTNDDSLHSRYRSLVAARVKRGFRKSSLLSSIRYAISQAGAAPSNVGRGVLCVDDDPEILTFVKRCLEPEGYTVEVCESGEEALDKVRTRQYGLVLLDLAMPGLDGWETARRIRSDTSITGLRIYVITAKPIENDKALLEEIGIDGYLMKPFRPDDLVEAVRGLEPQQASEEI